MTERRLKNLKINLTNLRNNLCWVKSSLSNHETLDATYKKIEWCEENINKIRRAIWRGENRK